MASTKELPAASVTSMTPTPELPATHRALVLTSTSSPPTIQTIPTPTPTPGSVVVRTLVANVLSYMGDIYNGTRNYPFPTPLVPGSSVIARVSATGPDSTLLQPGQLVIVDVTVRSRDNPADIFLLGIHQGFSAGSAKLMHGEWRDATYAEYAKVPLENCHVLDEARLLGSPAAGGLGYTLADLSFLATLMPPYGGLRDIDLRAGETIIVAPATGAFGGAGVLVALALGARVIAMGRNTAALARVAATNPERIKTVPITGDAAADTAALLKAHPRIDAFFDISPPQAAGTTHIKSAIMALRRGGRASLMGGIVGDVAIPHGVVMHRDIALRGKWMYPREAVGEMVRMVEAGVVRLGEGRVKAVGTFPLESWEEAFEAAARNAGLGEQVLISPSGAV